MIVTLLELGPRRYVADVRRNGRRRKLILTPGIRDALKKRGRRLWVTDRFGEGKLGEQAQYEVV